MARAFSPGRRDRRRAKRGGFLSRPSSPIKVAMSASSLQSGDDIGNGPVDVPGSQNENDVAGNEDRPQESPDLFEIGLEVHLLVTELADLLVEGPSGDPRDGILSRG